MADTDHFQVGDFECIAIKDCDASYDKPGSRYFVNAPHDQLAQILRREGIELDQWNHYTSAHTCLLLRTGTQYILIDTGLGSGLPGRRGELIDHLKEEGISLNQIGIVLLTHGHPDHIGGNTDTNQHSNFPEARFIMAKAEWDYWTSEDTLSKKESARSWVDKNLLAISDRFDLIERDTEVSSGIQVIFAPGHTPGHLIVSVRSRGEQLLFTADIFHHPIHIQQPGWYSVYDVQIKEAIGTRREVLQMAASEKALVCSFHFPFPGLGHILQAEGGYRWQPIAD